MFLEPVVVRVHEFIEWSVYAMIVLVGSLVLLGLVNAVAVLWKTLSSRKARLERSPEEGPLPEGIISTYAYLHLLTKVLLVFVAIELIETFLAFGLRADPKVYLTGVLAAALVALARQIIVFFNPDAPEQHVGEMLRIRSHQPMGLMTHHALRCAYHAGCE